MRKILLLIAALGCVTALTAQTAARTYRTQSAPYDARIEADARSHKSDAAYMTFHPEAFMAENGTVSVGQVIDMPYAWTDGLIYLHLENVGSAYTLSINDQKVAEVEDPSTPAEFFLSPLVREGKNAVVVEMRPSRCPKVQAATPNAPRKAFAESYLFMQNKRSIRDFTLALVPDSTGRFGILKLDVIAQNGYNFDETVTVGYDIYSPQGKLLDFNIVDRVIAGRSTDTLHFTPYIYHTNENRWQPSRVAPPLYKVMLFTRRDGAYKEYMPRTVGFADITFREGKFYNFGKEIRMNQASYNAAADRLATRGQLAALKAKSVNMIRPDYPQPAWFYELCDELGLYVIDRANINAPDAHNDRTPSGTPSNDPTLADEYTERVKAMYYRSRNFTCVVGFALGGESGNGYAMYKAYQWLKSVETARPVIYEDAAGEWNSDL
ncbi:MAG: glycoside hydrolase family 2 TIM barrel-domain containing protein [Alistipes sp.]